MILEWNKSCIELIALYVHPKIVFGHAHLRAIMALDHSRVSVENTSGRIFCVRQVYFEKSCPQIWLRANQPFTLFIHYIWGERVLWGAVFIIQTSSKMQYFTIFQDKLNSFTIQDHRSTRGNHSKNFQNHQPAGSNFWKAPNLRRNFKRVTLQRDKKFIQSIFY